MQQATITVEYKKQPTATNRPGSLKDSTGQWWDVWTASKKPGGAILDNFEVGGTYSVGYTTRDYNGKEYHTITNVTQTGAAAPKANGHTVPRQPTAPADSERMFTCSILNAFIQAGKVELDPSDLMEATNIIRGTYKMTFGEPQ